MRHVAFLRGINVGGQSVVKMADVAAAFTAAGCINVRTFIASGNILFDTSKTVSRALDARIRRELARRMGAAPVVVYRSVADLERIVAAAPFGKLTADKRIKLYVAFLVATPRKAPGFPLRLPKEALEAIGATHTGDVLIVSRIKPSGWYGFPANWLEDEIGVPSTARSWSTVAKLAALGVS